MEPTRVVSDDELESIHLASLEVLRSRLHRARHPAVQHVPLQGRLQILQGCEGFEEPKTCHQRWGASRRLHKLLDT